MSTIYSQAVVKWNVEPLNGMPTVELGDNGLDWADKSMLSSYNAEMNSVISAFKTWKSDADRDAYYLFIVPKFSEGSVEGFMPRNRSFGFITKEQIVDRTVAHELGHGVFNLKHTFSDWAITQGTTDNLMDYSQGTKLWKPQWDYIHDPEFTTGLFDEMEDGASMGCPRTYYPSSFNYKTYSLNNPENGKYYTFLTPAGVPISLPSDAKDLKFGEDFSSQEITSSGSCYGGSLTINNIPKSALTSFKLGEVEYIGKIKDEEVIGDKGIRKSELFFKGYFKDVETSYTDSYSRGKNQFKIFVINKNGELEGVDCEVKTPEGNGAYLGDGKLDPGLNVPCVMTLTTQSAGDFSKETDDFANKLKALIVSGSSYINSDDKTIESKKIKDLNDRLSVYSSEFSKEGRKIYIVNAQIPYYLDSKGQQDFANQVVGKCGDLFDPKRMTFVCLPYYYSPQSQVSYKPYYFPFCVGYYSETLKSKAQGGFEIATDIYSQIPKPYVLIPYYLTYRGEIIELKPIRKEDVKGKEHIYDFRFIEDRRIEKYKDLLAAKQRDSVGVATSYILTYLGWNEDKKKVDQKIASFKSDNPQTNPNIINHEIFESCLSEFTVDKYSANARLFANWYRKEKFTNLEPVLEQLNVKFPKSSDPVDDCYFGGYNVVVYNNVLNKIDIIGIMLSPIGLDVVTDITGALYTGYYHDWAKTAGYTVGVAIPLVAVLKVGKTVDNLNELANGTKKLLREGEEYKIVDNVVSVTAKTLEELEASLKIKLGDNWDTFINDFRGDVAKLTKFDEPTGLVESWKYLKPYHPDLAKDINVLETIIQLKNNPSYTKMGLTDDLIASFNGADGLAYKQILDNLDNFGKNIEGKNIVLQDFGKLLSDLKEGAGKSDGANWIVKYLGDNSNSFSNKTLKFEYYINTAGARFVDVADITNNSKIVFYEFKSVSVVPPVHFSEQFIKDLNNAQSLDQIKWIFNRTKNPANFQQNILDAFDNLTLTDELARKFLGRNNATADDLRDLLELKFNDIFKLE